MWREVAPHLKPSEGGSMKTAAQRARAAEAPDAQQVGAGRRLAEKMINAHGGIAIWEQASSVTLELHGGGLLLVAKGQASTMRDVAVTVPTTGQRTVVSPFPKPGMRGVFDAGSVRIETDDAEVVERRDDPRPLFKKLRRQLRWDDLDLLYFSGYALWNYVSLPFVLLRGGYRAEAKDETTLVVTFPPDVHTHCPTQRFVLNGSGLLQRHLYTAEPVGRFARSVHVASGQREFDGLIFPTKRRVYPRGVGRARIPFPVLVRIDIDNVTVS
jgi:hypothetical protein